ncbi:hypothetical protein D9M71_522370 [compost metagenome]
MEQILQIQPNGVRDGAVVVHHALAQARDEPIPLIECIFKLITSCLNQWTFNVRQRLGELKCELLNPLLSVAVNDIFGKRFALDQVEAILVLPIYF